MSLKSITCEPSNPWLAGVASLFTTEFYETARDRLRPGGVLAQWVQLYALAPEDVAMIVRTLAEVFPHHALVRVDDLDTIVIAAMEPLALSAASLDSAQRLVNATPPIREDLRRYFRTDDVRVLLLEHLLLDERGIHTLQKRVRLFLEHGRDDAAAAIVETALTVAPDDPGLLAAALVLRPVDDENAFRSRAARIADAHPGELLRAGIALHERSSYRRAAIVFIELTRAHPESATAWHDLAATYEAMGSADAAEEARERARRLDPIRTGV